ncbi:condensin complex subunit 2 [Drosophila mojavensis]|uniref:Condensin complex subunit 2 n=1 Tax=Drosophila mojavensis TaxID=7230 RepID=B4KKW5_DROMO|nr:condensin complex subunit 2 [Drosophila mojavensis]EDW11695.1 uncharacterized protein Dmoj_GI17284 [Drosophila mojavensis]
MTLPRSETPLRRSAVGSHRESMLQDRTTMVNDDEAERREARRRTLLLQQTRPRESTILESIEENETIKKCLEIYNGNKLSRENAWSLSLIDTLSNLLDHHHKTLSNFKIAGSSLEASSKVYGLRVDSIYLDAMRMSAGLNARTLTQQQLNAAAADDNDDSANVGQVEGGGDGVIDASETAAPKAKKRKRKAVSTITKNKETLNARLDTAPLQDPVFGKLNSTVGSINASNRLMNNILPTKDSELRLRTNYRFWQNPNMEEKIEDYTLVNNDDKNTHTIIAAEWVNKMRRYYQQHLVLRPLHTGYIISDVPNPSNANDPMQIKDDDDGVDNADDFYENPRELSMAFDINAECEPMPDLNALTAATVLEMDYNEMDELTTEERTTLQHCRVLRKQPVLIEDLRPVDGSSKLEYSYRPMDQISQFWAGPSHWKFKRTRNTNTFAQITSQDNVTGKSTNAAAARLRRAAAQAAKRRSKQINFGQCTESLFKLDESTKLRKANYQKRWDPRKLRLPTKYDFDANYFYKYDYAPSIKVSRRFGVPDDDIDNDDDVMGRDMNAVGDDAGDDVDLFDNDEFQRSSDRLPNDMNVSSFPNADPALASFRLSDDPNACNDRTQANDTVLEISTEFQGAPSQVTKVIVPFAKRAKVIDMKNLKRSCNSLIQKQLLSTAEMEEEAIPAHPKGKQEHYAKGMATFKEIYEKLPAMLTTKMSDSLSPSVALYAVLHLANDMRLRLIPQDDFEDFTIRQITD